MKLLTHLNDVHGAEAINGMAGLMAWSQGPTRALGRFDAGTPAKTIDEMYACARGRSSRKLPSDALCARWDPNVRGAVRDAQRPRIAIGHRPFQHPRGAAGTMGGLSPGNRPRRPGDRHAVPVGPRPRPGAGRQARDVGLLAVVSHRARREVVRRSQDRDGSSCHREDHPRRAGLRGKDHPAHHVHSAPHGHHVRPIPINGLYLGSAGCHGGPGITFIPGYNAAQQALAEAG